MEILISNAYWMIWNSFLAVLPVLFAYLYFKTPRQFYKGVLAVLWFLYFPNALYVITDLEHLVEQWGKLDILGRLLATIQYIHLEVIGLTAFIVALYAFEKELTRIFSKAKRRLVVQLIITMNFLTGFAMVLGKVERINSWEVFTATERVWQSVSDVLRNDQLVWLAILFGIFGNIFYFLLHKPIIEYARRVLKKH